MICDMWLWLWFWLWDDYDIWYMIYDICYMIYDICYMIYDIWYIKRYDMLCYDMIWHDQTMIILRHDMIVIWYDMCLYAHTGCIWVYKFPSWGNRCVIFLRSPVLCWACTRLVWLRIVVNPQANISLVIQWTAPEGKLWTLDVGILRVCCYPLFYLVVWQVMASFWRFHGFFGLEISFL